MIIFINSLGMILEEKELKLRQAMQVMGLYVFILFLKNRPLCIGPALFYL